MKAKGGNTKTLNPGKEQFLTIIFKYMETIIDNLYIHYMIKDLNYVCSRNSFRNGLDRESENFRMPDETQFISFVHFFGDSHIFQRKKNWFPLKKKKSYIYRNKICQLFMPNIIMLMKLIYLEDIIQLNQLLELINPSLSC